MTQPMNERMRFLLLAQATQDHELAGVRDLWKQTEFDMKEEFVAWLEDEDTGRVRDVFNRLPPSWIVWIQKCATCGLREAVLQDAETSAGEAA